MSEPVTYRLGGSDLGRQLLEPVCKLYDEVFSRPPFFWRHDESELHRTRLLALFEKPSFGLTAALDRDEVIGFAYGFTLPSDSHRWQELSEPLPKDLAAEWPNRTFVLFDYAVRETYRSRGVGKALHDRLLESRSEERATLTVQPTAVDTQNIYQHWGWRKVGFVEGGPTAAAPIFDVYLLDQIESIRSRTKSA